MTDNLFLILHKVRGLSAFDIASQIEVKGEQWWIIPTSGHRAYPWKAWSLEDLIDVSWNIPSHWPDHYSANEPRKASAPRDDLNQLFGGPDDHTRD